MKPHSALLALLLSTSASAAIQPATDDIQATTWALRAFSRLPLAPLAANAANCTRVIERYLQQLDPQRKLFLQSEVDTMRAQSGQLCERGLENNLPAWYGFANQSLQAHQRLLADAELMAATKPDFTARESLPAVRDNSAWPASDGDRKDLWRRLVKRDWLDLKLAGVTDQEIVTALGMRYASERTKAADTDHTDILQQLLNAYAATVDSHSSYIAPAKNSQPVAAASNIASLNILTLAQDGKQHRIGVIRIPALYVDYEARRTGKADYTSVTRDVARMLRELQAKHIDSVLLDLRDNGGGALTEVQSLAGLFIGPGPVLQGRDSSGKHEVIFSPKEEAAWTGRVAALIDRTTASGAEMIAAALQDYGRGLVIGETGYGMGTVMTMFSLDRFANAGQHYGDIKLTVQTTQRITGAAFQQQGVTPDIRYTTSMDDSKPQEAALPNALPPLEAAAARYTRLGDFSTILPALQARHRARLKNDQTLQALAAAAQRNTALRMADGVTLNEAERRQQLAAQQQAPGNAEARDAVLNEAARILIDQAELQR